MADDFASGFGDLKAPADGWINVTPDDANDLAHLSRGILVAVAGNLKVTDNRGNTSVIPVPAGQISARVRRIWSTSTTATGISILY